MKNGILIGESGGSKTDWAMLQNNEVQWRVTLPSLHPKKWNTDLFNDLLINFIDNKVDFKSTDLLFFGAGCNGVEKANKLKKYFDLFGFRKVEIFGDLKAAGLAASENSDDYVAILGSGSVLIKCNKGSVAEHFGGLGREFGDEGAGFYFGKLVLEAYCKKELTAIEESILLSVLSFQEQKALDTSKIDENLCLVLAKKLGNNLFEFERFHLQNFELFYEKYVKKNAPKQKIIHFIGSYAYYHQEILKSYFLSKNIEIGKVIARPLDKIVEFYIASTEKEKKA